MICRSFTSHLVSSYSVVSSSLCTNRSRRALSHSFGTVFGSRGPSPPSAFSGKELRDLTPALQEARLREQPIRTRTDTSALLNPHTDTPRSDQISDTNLAIFSSSRSRGSTCKLRSYISWTSPALCMLRKIYSCSSGTAFSGYGAFWYC